MAAILKNGHQIKETRSRNIISMVQTMYKYEQFDTKHIQLTINIKTKSWLFSARLEKSFWDWKWKTDGKRAN